MCGGDESDNRGEGGSFALLSLIARNLAGKKWTSSLVMLGVLATCLFYGDAMITPAISVLSAVEGLTIVEAPLQPLVIPISIAILVGLFVVQSRGTAKVGDFRPSDPRLSGRVGCARRQQHHSYIRRSWQHLVPTWALQFFATILSWHFWRSDRFSLQSPAPKRFTLIWATSAAGRSAWSWLTLVYPCLMLNYLGQGALLLGNPAPPRIPFT